MKILLYTSSIYPVFLIDMKFSLLHFRNCPNSNTVLKDKELT